MVLLQVRAGAYARPEEHEGHVHDVAAADGAERAHGDRSDLMNDATKSCQQRSYEVIRCHQAT